MTYFARTFVGLAVFGTSWLTAHSANAEPSETDRGLSQSLFEEGKRLMKAKKYAEACPKLEESHRLDPSGGTLLNLALCHELEGKIATAWSDFKGALSLAKKDGRNDRIKAATDHIAIIEPKLPFLTVAVPISTAGEKITLDGGSLGQAAWGSALSIDPGTHEVTASAPGRTSWSAKIEVGVGEKKTLTIPGLEQATGAAPVSGSDQPASDESAPKDEPSSSEAPPDEGSGKRTAGFVIGGVGIVGLGVGTFFGLQTLSKHKDSDAECPTDDTCTPKGVTLNDQAHTSAWVSNIGFGVGVVGLAVGTYLIVTSGDSGSKEKASNTRSRSAGLQVNLASSGGNVSWAGVW